MADRYVDYLPLDQITVADRNPKGHDQAGIGRSIGHFGLGELPLLDERTGRLVAGHGRYAQLVTAHHEGQDPPDGVRVADDGTWLMPTIRGWASRSDADAEAYLVASNQLTVTGGWDDRALAELLQDLADQQLLDVTGFADTDLQQLLADLDTGTALPPAALTDPDSLPEPPPEPRTARGDVWLLGPHRVLCGDATDVAAVEEMLDGDRCHMLWTDPPYGVDYVGKTADALTIRNDGAAGLPDLLAGAFATATAVLQPGAPVYIAHAPGPLAAVFAAAFTSSGWSLRQNLIWVKDAMVLGHADYHYRHEPILYGFTAGGNGRLGRGGDRWFGDNAQTTVFEVPKPSRSSDHPTMKPVELITRALVNSCPPGGLVLDLFGGSGSTLIAAHHHRAAARLVELDARYVDVICRRWQEHTGTTPVLAATGEEHDFTASPANP